MKIKMKKKIDESLLIFGGCIQNNFSIEKLYSNKKIGYSVRLSQCKF